MNKMISYKQFFNESDGDARRKYGKMQADAMKKVVSPEWMHELTHVLRFKLNKDKSVPMERVVYSHGTTDVTFYFGSLGGTHVEAVQVTGLKSDEQETLQMPGMFHGLDKENLMRHIKQQVGAFGGGPEMSFSESTS